MRWLPLVLLACKAGAPAAPTAPAVWIDTDPSVGEPDRDVDDGLALLQALHAPEIDVRGITVVFGNAPLDRADPITRELVTAWSPATPVHTGADGAHRDRTPAVDALIAALERERLRLLVLGPATNIAALLHHRPDLAPRIVDVIAVAGRLPGQRFTTGTTNTRAHRDFNFEQDPEAFRELLAHDVPVTLAPFEISRKVWMHGADLDALEAGPHSARLVAPARGWLGLWERVFAVDGFNPFDTLAVATLLTPDLLTCETAYATIEVGPDDRTEATMQGTDAATKPYLVVRSEGTRAVRWCHDVDSAPFKADLIQRLTGP